MYGASETISNVEKFLTSIRFGSFQNCGIRTAYPWIIMEEASNRLQRFSSTQV
jgi:hypothetical protein